MNILVFSDSHGHPERMTEAFDKQIKKPDAVIFLGDGLGDVARCSFGSANVYSVSGNCDYSYSFLMPPEEPTERIFEICGKRIMLTHGHRYSVKSGLGRIVAEAVKQNVDILLFGHTHEKLELYLPAGESDFGICLEKPLYVMNPGSVGAYPSSFGCIEINPENVLISHG